MKKMPKPNTQIEKSSAFVEGIRAFQEGKQRRSNPYIETNPDLAVAWWNGWLTAAEGSNQTTPLSKDEP